MANKLCLVAFLVTNLFFSCNKKTEGQEVKNDTTATASHTPSQSQAEQLAAFYNGKFACSHCDSVSFALTLNADVARTYSLTETHIAQDDVVEEFNGNWTIQNDIVSLSEKKENNQLKITNEGLTFLNTDGSQKYALKKVLGE